MTRTRTSNAPPGNLPLLVLAGGFGTRLRAVVPDLPKPLAPVAGIPFLEHLLKSWIHAGQREFVFLLHHQSEKITAFLRSLESSLLQNARYSIVVEDIPLGTGGAVANAVHGLRLTSPFLLTNADTWLGDSLRGMHAMRPPAMAVVSVPETARYGTVQFDARGIVTGFVEKQGASGPGWINAGMYLLHPEEFTSWDANPFSLEQDFFPHLVSEGRLRAVPLQTKFIDIGVPEDYKRFSEWIEKRNSDL